LDITQPREFRESLLDPAPPETLHHYQVAKAVGNVRNNGPELIEPLPSAS